MQCPLLALAVHLSWKKTRGGAEGLLVFTGSSSETSFNQALTAAARDGAVLGIHTSTKITTHSVRKGGASDAMSIAGAGASTAALMRRGQWPQGATLNAYFKTM